MNDNNIKSVEKALDVLNVLMRNFAHGYTNKELSDLCGLSATTICRYLQTLEAKGFAERIPETGRIRASHRHAQFAVQIQLSLDEAIRKLEESKMRILRGAQ
ncbi:MULTISPECIES: helix-turn-helix domain-containing protein [Methylococcus]|uniref:Helix-turn-helix domain-containing protein n=1 Tax=Methylococcus capsulatus TaxID=414 RepID=A0ABZ2F3A0_METCP|nr:helix-turn-helix domain-containing protein [Methylococcus sp. BF19-07]